MLRTGEQYKQSLRDGRRVFVQGEQIDDVTAAPSLGGGISLIAEMCDDHFTDEHREVLTYVGADGKRRSRAWHAPVTPEELVERRRVIEYTSMKTAGTFGRAPDLAPTIAVGLLARKPLFKKSRPEFAQNNPDFAENIDRYVEYGAENGITAAEVLTEPQSDRSRASGAGPALLRVVSQEKNGVRVSGAKSVGSLAAQADEIIFTNLKHKDYPPEACIWAAVPVATEGLTLVCREGVSRPDASAFDHPVASRGEECDQLIIFDNVLIPNERVFNVGDPDLLSLYGPVTVWAHWQILTRMAVKSEIFVGAAQCIVDALGTGSIPGVRTMVGELIEYSQACRAFVLAAEARAELTEGGVLAPDPNMLTAGRLYAVAQYPRVIHTLQELCGQGLVMRFSEKDFLHEEIGAYLNRLLPGHEISAMDKNRLMNFVWDMTTDSHAGRTELFENVNGGAAPALRERLYVDYPRERVIAQARELAGLD